MVWGIGPRFHRFFWRGLPSIETGIDHIASSAIVRGTDCDDADAAVGTGDLDGDGYDACDADNPTDCG